MRRLPLIAPQPPRLSDRTDTLRAIEDRGVFSNGGPVVRGFEADARDRLFGGAGDCLAVANATLGLMMAIRHAAGCRAGTGAYALMPGFTFAATAQAAQWAGLTPLICDIDPESWLAAADAEAAAFERYGDQIAVVVPYATFGTVLDLDRYAGMARDRGVGVVIDAAASLGTLTEGGRNFGAGAPFAIVYSMHATKTFSTAEGGLIHSGDAALIAALRNMHNFGFAGARSAAGPGINAKLPEVLGALASARLEDFEAVAAHRHVLARTYRAHLPGFTFQEEMAARQAHQFLPVLLPQHLVRERAAILADLDKQGVAAGHYFSPHLGEQPWFRASAVCEPLPVCDAVAARMLSLPITDAMTVADTARAAGALAEICGRRTLEQTQARARAHAPAPVDTLLVGGGPAGTAMLTAASKHGLLRPLAARGLTIVERGGVLGGGALGSYAITSDSAAETFLSAVKDNPEPSIAALMEHGSAHEIARHIGALGVPLARSTPFLEATGEALGAIVEQAGGSILRHHEVVEARRAPGELWQVRVRDLLAGTERVITARNIVLATGGYQAREDVAHAELAGATLGELAGDRLIPGDAFLKLGGPEALAERLRALPAPRVAIIGASTSALASAALLLKQQPALPLGAGAVTLLHRQKLRPFYPSVEAAHADGFTDFGADDICPVSGFVYRLAGFRLEARDLALRMLGIGGRVPDPRLSLLHLRPDSEAQARQAILNADAVIGALGYRPRALPLLDGQGAPIALSAHLPGRPRLVDQHCRVIDARGVPVPGAYGIGLAAGFVPRGKLGGEPSFRGKANGLWLWQNDVGLAIVEQLLDAAARKAA